MSRWGQFQEIADLPERAFCENKYERTLEGGGGKGGSQTQQTQIPRWAGKAAKQNIKYAREAARIGYMPYYGPQVAAFNPTQLAAMQSNIGAAEAFGLVPQGQLTAAQGMPAPTEYAGGFQGYGSGDLYDQAVAEFEARRPGQAAAYNAMFVDPITGQGGMLQDGMMQGFFGGMNLLTPEQYARQNASPGLGMLISDNVPGENSGLFNNYLVNKYTSNVSPEKIVTIGGQKYIIGD